jgi:hypothetical protein
MSSRQVACHERAKLNKKVLRLILDSSLASSRLTRIRSGHSTRFAYTKRDHVVFLHSVYLRNKWLATSERSESSGDAENRTRVQNMITHESTKCSSLLSPSNRRDSKHNLWSERNNYISILIYFKSVPRNSHFQSRIYYTDSSLTRAGKSDVVYAKA